MPHLKTWRKHFSVKSHFLKSVLNYHVLSFVLLLVLACLPFYRLFFQAGYLAKGDFTYPADFDQLLKVLSANSNVWGSRWYSGINYLTYGQNFVSLLVVFVAPVLVPAGNIGASFLSFATLLAGLTMYFASFKLTRKIPAALLAAVMYMYSSFFGGVIIGNFLGHIIAYGFLPAVAYLLMLMIRDPTKKHTTLAGIALAFLLAVSLPETIMMVGFAIAFLVYTLMLDHKKRNYRAALSFFISDLLALGLNSFWVLPYFIYVNSVNSLVSSSQFVPSISLLFTYPQSITATILNQSIGELSDIVSTLGAPSINVNLISSTFLMIFVALSALKPSRHSLFLSIVAVFSIFMAKGSSQPFGDVYIWLYLHVPGFVMFNRSYFFMSFVSLSYAFLIAFACNIVMTMFKPQEIQLDLTKLLTISTHTTVARSARIRSRAKSIISHGTIFSIVLILILAQSWPFLTGNFEGRMKTLRFPYEYSLASDWLEHNAEGYSVLLAPPYDAGSWTWFPSWQNNQPELSYPPVTNPFFQYPSTSMHTMGWGYPTPNSLSFYAINELYLNKTELMGKVLGLLGIKYIVVQSDEGDVSHWISNLYTFQNTSSLMAVTLPNTLGISQTWQNGSITIFENKRALPLFFSSRGFAVATGDMRLLNSLAALEPYNFSSLPVSFVSQLGPDAAETIVQSSLIIINGNNWKDLLMAEIPSDQVVDIPLSADLSLRVREVQTGSDSWADSSHVKSFDWGRPFIAEGPISYPGNWIMSSGKNVSLSLPFSVQSESEYQLWGNIYAGQLSLSDQKQINSGMLSVELDGEAVWLNETSPLGSESGGFKWLRLNNSFLTPGKHTVTLINVRGFNFVQRLVLLKPTDYESAASKVEQLTLSKPLMIILNPWSLFRRGQTIVLQPEDFIESGSLDWYFSNSASYGSFTGTGWVGSSLNGSALTMRFFISAEGTYALAVRGLEASDKGGVNYLMDGRQFAFESWFVDAENRWSNRTIGVLHLTSGYHDLTMQALNLYNRAFAVGYDEFVITTAAEGVDSTKDFRSAYGYAMLVRDTSVSSTFETQSDGIYHFAFRLSGQTNATITIDDEPVYNSSLSDLKYAIFESRPTDLQRGNHTITVASKGTLYVDQMVAFSTPDTTPSDLTGFLDAISDKHESQYSQINPSEYSVNIHSDPNVVVFLQSYNDFWKSSDGTHEITSIPMFGYANGFINVAPRSTVYYQLYTFQQYGTILSITLSVACLILLFARNLPISKDKVKSVYKRMRKEKKSSLESTQSQHDIG